MTAVDTYRVRSHGCSRLREEATVSEISLPKVTAFTSAVNVVPLRRIVTPIEPQCADKAARIAMIRAAHRKLVRMGMFAHIEGRE